MKSNEEEAKKRWDGEKEEYIASHPQLQKLKKQQNWIIIAVIIAIMSGVSGVFGVTGIAILAVMVILIVLDIRSSKLRKKLSDEYEPMYPNIYPQKESDEINDILHPDMFSNESIENKWEPNLMETTRLESKELTDGVDEKNNYIESHLQIEENEEEILEIKQENTVNNPESSKIHGWLTFFLITLGLGSTVTIIYSLATLSLDEYDWGLGYWMIIFAASCDVIMSLGIGALGFYTIVSFYKCNPNAVFLGKTYLIFIFVTNLLVLFAGEYEASGIGSQNYLIRSLGYSIIWFCYLCQSKQINKLCPKEERKIYKRDKIIICAIIAPLILLYLIIYDVNYFKDYNNNNEIVLAENEYTDGITVFKNPTGLNLEKIDLKDITGFKLTLLDDELTILLISCFDNNETQEYFDECILNWKDEFFNDFEYKIINEQHSKLNGNSFHLKTVEYESYPIVKWSFVMLFDEKTSKCCAISCHEYIIDEHQKNTDYLQELINSIRFK